MGDNLGYAGSGDTWLIDFNNESVTRVAIFGMLRYIFKYHKTHLNELQLAVCCTAMTNVLEYNYCSCALIVLEIES